MKRPAPHGKMVDEMGRKGVFMDQDNRLFGGGDEGSLVSFAPSSIVRSRRILYTPSAFARSALFYLQEAGSLKAVKPHTNARKGLDSFLFFTVMAGRGKLIADGKGYDLSAGDCIFIDCQKSYSHSTGCDLKAPDQLWTLKWAHFGGREMRAIYGKYKARGGQPVFRPEGIKEYVAILDQLYEIGVSDSYVRDMEIHAKLSQLFVLLMKDAWPEGGGEKGRGKREDKGTASFDIQAVKEYLDGHFTEKISLDALASRFFINKFYLLKRFKERYGTTVNDYLIHKRITKAKQLLRFGSAKDGTPFTVEEVSLECGFSNGAYMSRVFKRTEGISPGEYRKLW